MGKSADEVFLVFWAKHPGYIYIYIYIYILLKIYVKNGNIYLAAKSSELLQDVYFVNCITFYFIIFFYHTVQYNFFLSPLWD